MLAVVAVAVFAVLHFTGSSPTHTLTGKIRLTASGLIHGANSTCTGTGGFDDMASGTDVVVKDSNGKIVATSRLQPGVTPTGEKYPNVLCDFAFTVPALPKTGFYSVEVGTRGAKSYSYADMQKAGWVVSLNLSS